MTGPARFDIEALRDIAGPSTFARGEAYQREGRVEILALGPERVLARVSGTQEYRTQVVGRGDRIGGACACPAFDDTGFCKHMVAVALAANVAASEPGAGRDDPMSRIRAHLLTKGVDELAGMLIELASDDPDLFRKLDVAASMASADDKTLEAQLRKAIDSATRTGAYVDYRRVPDWAARVHSALELVDGLLAAGRAAIALRLAERALDRIEKATEAIDDSDGHCGALLARLRETHLAAARAAPPDPIPFARALFIRQTEDDYGVFDGAAETYADVLGPKGLAEYHRLASEAWEELATAERERDRQWIPHDERQLASILDFFAERDGDVERRIALRSRNLDSSWGYLQLAEFCLSIGRTGEALRRAEEGLWLFEDKPDPRLVRFTADLLARAGRADEAEAHLWRAFEKGPTLELYSQLRALAGERVRPRATQFLENWLSGQPSGRWRSPADLLAAILMGEERFDEAWACAEKWGVSLQQAQALARASESTHPREAIAAYAARVDELARGGGNQAYAEAAALVAHMASLQGAAEQGAYVAELKARYSARRNLMRLLP